MNFLAQQQAVIRFARAGLGEASGQNGKVFYSSPRSLFAGRYILMGYNPGGDPVSHAGCRISDNLDEWGGLRQNHYWTQKWNRGRDDFNNRQKRVHALFEKLDINQAEAFTSNLWFLRSRNASTLKHGDAVKDACVAIWKTLLARSPARRVICIGVRTCEEFLEVIKASEIMRKRVRTCHPLALARLVNARIQTNAYKITAVPHLSGFNVAEDSNLIRRIVKHFK